MQNFLFAHRKVPRCWAAGSLFPFAHAFLPLATQVLCAVVRHHDSHCDTHCPAPVISAPGNAGMLWRPPTFWLGLPLAVVARPGVQIAEAPSTAAWDANAFCSLRSHLVSRSSSRSTCLRLSAHAQCKSWPDSDTMERGPLGDFTCERFRLFEVALSGVLFRLVGHTPSS